MKSKPKFDKKKCRKCMYRGSRMSIGYYPTNRKTSTRVYCDYASRAGCTCLTREGDRRGDDYNNCLLYKKGDPVRIVEFTGGKKHETEL